MASFLRILAAAIVIALVVCGAESRTPKYKCDCKKLKRVVKSVYRYVWDHPRDVVMGKNNLTNVWAPNPKARITPLGEYNDREGVIEYFYGLGSTLDAKSIDYVKLVCDCSTKPAIVAADVNVLQVRNGVKFNFTHFGFFTFSDTNSTIVSAEVTFTNLGFGVDAKTAAERQKRIASTCAIVTLGVGNGTTGSCIKYQNLTQFTGTTPQEQFSDCTNFLSSIAFGTFDRAYSNSTTCRMVHSFLTLFNPLLHCPHVGRTGGNACIDFTYDSWYQNVY